ncbi:MAG: SGNH/GDSL hydrolase family protein [Candidatus Hydrogenedentes bacterium]|nr:SGNH/GDSL hydrolase family protein [Candidatus Hydrogenedentota bacterium]
MHRKRISAVVLMLVASVIGVQGMLKSYAESAPGGKQKMPADAKRENIEWLDTWVMAANGTKLPRVLLIGDSIARSYYPGVEKALQGKAECARLATSKSLCDPAFRKELALMLDDYEFAVIHINNGLHGWDYTEADYAKRLPEVLEFIHEHAKGAKIIWASTTPVRKAKAVTELDPRTDRVRERNRIAESVAKAHSYPIDDLFTPVIDHPEYFSDDGVHFKAEGVDVLARLVVGEITKALPPTR